MYLVKPDMWCVKCFKWSGGVVLNFGLLAFDAGESPIMLYAPGFERPCNESNTLRLISFGT